MGSVARFAPPLLLMGLIFLVSAQETLPSVDSALDVVVKKAAHMAEFGVLWALWLRALAGPRPRAALWALAITLVYAVSDELHQSMVDGRTSSSFDVAIDAAGIGVAVLVWRLRATRARRP
ncbi:MAG: VanZ family protein [Actinomycetota bacterium]|nr:VanZ family protein [Actinomycetota bacterium]